MTDDRNQLLARITDLESKLDSIAFYIAMKERGNERQVTPKQLEALAAAEDRFGTDSYWMHRFVGRYKDAFHEGKPQHFGL